MTNNKKELSPEQKKELLDVLKKRFEKNAGRHKDLEWSQVEDRLKANPEKMRSLNEMERSGGEPDVVKFNAESEELYFVDCSAESPKGRRSLCYDREALEARKEHKPKNSVIDVATEMGVELLDEEQYRELKKCGPFDTKTSSWLKTPSGIRDQGGAIFGDFRYGNVFIYHNGASSYYAARGFRGCLKFEMDQKKEELIVKRP